MNSELYMDNIEEEVKIDLDIRNKTKNPLSPSGNIFKDKISNANSNSQERIKMLKIEEKQSENFPFISKLKNLCKNLSDNEQNMRIIVLESLCNILSNYLNSLITLEKKLIGIEYPLEKQLILFFVKITDALFTINKNNVD